MEEGWEGWGSLRGGAGAPAPTLLSQPNQVSGFRGLNKGNGEWGHSRRLGSKFWQKAFSEIFLFLILFQTF